MAPERQPLLGRLQRAVRKVRALLSIDKSRWLLSSFLSRTSTWPRRLSFKNPPAGLLDCIDDDDDRNDFHEVGSTFVLSRTTSMATDRSRSTTPASSDITRSSSGASSTDDIDRRADDFIANFYKHIRMERQVSLELRYLGAKDGSLQRTRSDS